MAGTRRPDIERRNLEARARMLRVTGLSMSEISRDVGVPVSTLNQWAGQSAWLLSDLTGEIAALPPDDTLLPAREAIVDVGPGVGASVGNAVSLTDITPDEAPNPVQAVVQALAHARALTAAGQLAAADKAGRLSERLFGIAAKTGVMGAVLAGRARLQCVAQPLTRRW